MKQTNTLRRALVSVLAVMVLVLTAFGTKQVDAASTIVVALPQSGGTSQKFFRDPSFSLEKDSSWITIKASSASDFTINASANSTGKGRIGYVYVKRQGSVVTTYKVIQPGTTTISVDGFKGSTSTFGKNSNQTLYVSVSWITLYCPNNYNFRMDYAANTTGSTRTGCVYVKEGSNIITTYKITQKPTFRVTYDKNGGSGSNFTRTISYGSVYGKVDNPTKSGDVFLGWYTKKEGGKQVTETTIMSTSENHTLYAHWRSDGYYLGSVKDPDSGKTYKIYMVPHDVEKEFDKKHSGLLLKIVDGKDGNGGIDYCIRNSWAFRDDTFKKDVCKLIVDWNKYMGRTGLWNRKVTSCVDEWTEHNLIYCLATEKSSNWIPLFDWDEFAKQSVDVDLDSKADGYIPVEVWEGIKGLPSKAYNALKSLFGRIF